MTRSFNLRQDSAHLLRSRWLRPGEALVMYTPSWGKPPRLEGIPKPPLTWTQLAWKILRGIGWAFAFIFILALMAAAEGGDASGGSRRKPAIVAKGNGRSSIAGQVVLPTIRRKGVWALSDHRLAFLEISGDIDWESSSRESDQFASRMDKRPPSEVTMRALVELSPGQFQHDGIIERTGKRLLTRRAWTIGQYYRISFADGSELNLKDRRQ